MVVLDNLKLVLHKISVRLYPNPLPSLEGTYIARSKNKTCLTVEQVCAALKKRGGFTGSYDDLVKHVQLYFEEAAYQLCTGFAIDTSYFSIHPGIGGAFKSLSEPYDRKKHPVEFTYKTRLRLRRLADFVEVEIEGPADTSGSIEAFIDVETGSKNEVVTSGELFNISGRKIKVVGDDPSIGVYFISSEDPENMVKVTRPLSHNSAGKLSGAAPQLTGGAWIVAVKTQFNGTSSSFLKKPRTVTSKFELEAVSLNSGHFTGLSPS